MPGVVEETFFRGQQTAEKVERQLQGLKPLIQNAHLRRG